LEHKKEDIVLTVSTTLTETPEWPTGDESFYNNRQTPYSWDDVILTKEDVRRAAFNEAVHCALQARLEREKQLMALAIQELTKACSEPSHVIKICDWV